MTITTVAESERDTPPLNLADLKEVFRRFDEIDKEMRKKASRILWPDGLHELKPGDVVIVHPDSLLSTLVRSVPWVRVTQYPEIMKPTEVIVINERYLNPPYR